MHAPATLTSWNAGWHLYLSGTATLAQTNGTRVALDADGNARGSVASTATTLGWGGTLAGWYRWAEQPFAVGLATSTPPSQAAPNVADWRYASQGGHLRTARLLTLALAFKAGPVRAGVGLHYAHTRADLRFARDTGLANQGALLGTDCGGTTCGVEEPSLQENWRFVGGTSIGNPNEHLFYTLSVAFPLAEHLSLGLLFESNENNDLSDMEGTLTVQQAPRDGGTTISGRGHVRVEPSYKAAGELRGTIAGRLELHVGASWERLSPFTHVDVRATDLALLDAGVPEVLWRPRAYQNITRMYVGVESPDVGQRLRAGTRVYVNSPETDAFTESPLVLSGWEVGLGAGLQLRVGASTIVELQVTAMTNPGDDHASAFDPAAVRRCEAALGNITNPDCALVQRGYGQPSLKGQFSRMTATSGLSVRYDF